MKMKKIITRVRFLVNETDGKDLFACFVDHESDSYDGSIDCYSHVGQHSATSKVYITESREATKEEYQPLAEELQSIGYNLEILNSIS